VARLWILLWCLVFPALGWGADPVAIPPLSTRVTDLTATLSAEQSAALEASLEKIEREKGAQIAIVLLPTTQPESIEQFGIRLAEAWKIGRWRVNDGIIIVLAKDDRAARIEVGRALEGPVPDVVARRIIADVMAPKLKEGDFAGGLQAAVAALAGAIAGEALPAPAVHQPEASTDGGANFILLFLALILGSVLRSLLGLVGATLAAIAAGWLAWSIFASWIAALIAAAITLLFSYARGGGRGWSAGGTGGALGGGFSGSSSGGGGFSGGGGEFGGGGASGNW
jgi:uncharacterized protein